MVKWRPSPKREESRDVNQKSKAGDTADSAAVAKVARPKTRSSAIVSTKRPPSGAPPHFADDLIRRVMITIDEWAAANGLSNLPRKVIFEQALSIMTALYENSSSGNPGDKR
jgi:hypothetical protein